MALVRPRDLDPYFISTPLQQSQGNVNPFWSDPGRREAPGSRTEPEQPRPGDRKSPTQQEVEAVRERVLREAEERFAKEIRKISGGGDSASFESVTSAGGERVSTYDKPSRVDAGIEVPPGLTGAPVKGEPQTNQIAVPETVRSLELPALPHPAVEGAALQFGDWLVLVYPLMSDLSATSQQWWEGSLAAARRLYEQWLVASPLDRLRLRPTEARVDPLHLRVEQRGVAMLIGVLPEQLRRDIISAGSPSTISILFRLHVVFQPGGGAERTILLKSLTEVKVSNNVPDLLVTMRQWRRWLQRAEDLTLTLPDPVILMQVLGKLMDSMSKLGGSQMAYRISTVRQELMVDQRPELRAIKGLGEYLQAELEDLSLMSSVPKSSSATASGGQSSGTQALAVKALQTSSAVEERPKAACKFWGTTHGCRRVSSAPMYTVGTTWRSRIGASSVRVKTTLPRTAQPRSLGTQSEWRRSRARRGSRRPG